MPKVEKIESNSTSYLNKTLVQERGVKKLTIKTVPQYEIVDFTDKKTGETKSSKKMCCTCTTNVLDPQEVIWQMNQTTSNYLIDTLGDNTDNWVGKEIEIAIKQMGSAQPGIYPKACSLEKVLA